MAKKLLLPCTERETLGSFFFFIWQFIQKIIRFFDGNRYEFALQKLRNVSLSYFSLQIGKTH